MQLINPAGSIFSPALVVRDANGNITGTTAETTFPAGSYTLPANYLRAGRNLSIDAVIVTAVQGAVASTFRCKFGGVTLHAVVTTSAADKMYKGCLLGVGAAAQVFRGTFEFTTGAAGSGSTAAPGIDTTVDQLFEFTLQPGAATDSWTLRHFILGIEEQRT